MSPMQANTTPQQMVITGPKNTIQIKDVLIGEVWLCSGQSNMEFSVKNTASAKEALKDATKRQTLRIFIVTRTPAGLPKSHVNGIWHMSNPGRTRWVSAVAYFFGRELVDNLDVPVGLLQSAWGGTAIQSWTSAAGFESEPLLKKETQWIHDQQASYNILKNQAVPLITKWLPKAQAALAQNQSIPELPTWPEHPIAKSHGNPTSLYNAMIAPLIPYAIRGTVWYQGEANQPEGTFYETRLKALIHSWRDAWSQPKLPFGVVQIAPFGGYRNDKLPLFWEAQTKAVKQTPHTGLVVTTDLGNPKNIHPTRKLPVAKRLALWARATVYGEKNLVYSGPAYKSMEIRGNSISLSFDHVGSGLTSRDGKPLTHWLIAGKDQKFSPAQAICNGNQILVSSDKVPSPVAVRFAWDKLANPNFINKEGLPAQPLRTDQWD
ncbi:MAG: hypothetical protein JKX85_13430 [Phycisphaeraceae bacterium]|nr:hypothetical protein [Phycisphaeraceae bacterium]